MTQDTFKIAAVQATPVILDRAATVDLACNLIAEAGRAGARLVVFPEAFVPGYPHWVWDVPPSDGNLLSALHAQLLANSVSIPSDATVQLGKAAKAAGVYVAIGVNERNVEASGASLYNTLLYFDPQGNILGKHRKLVPTGAERLVWAQGDGSTLCAFDTSLGKLGGLICWENYMPLARYTMYASGVQIYLAPTWDQGEPWLSTLRHIAKEGRTYVVGCCIAMQKSDIPDSFDYKQRIAGEPATWINSGDSVIVNPEGEIIAGPAHETRTILYADLDLSRVRGAKWMLDVAGHYARPDVFNLTVNRTPHAMIDEA
jgi:nitrilase